MMTGFSADSVWTTSDPRRKKGRKTLRLKRLCYLSQQLSLGLTLTQTYMTAFLETRGPHPGRRVVATARSATLEGRKPTRIGLPLSWWTAWRNYRWRYAFL